MTGVEFEIDVGRLPKRAAVDNSVLSAALKPGETEDPSARRFFAAMVAGNQTVVIPAPAFAEARIRVPGDLTRFAHPIRSGGDCVV